MSISIQTNIASLNAQNAIRVNTAFQNNTIEQLSSGYRINSSADDAAGLAVANQYAASTAELTQGVLNANNGTSSLQIVDGGLSNITTILNRLTTLATESASSTFTGSRTTLNNEYQGLLAEVDRQASNINLNTGGTNNADLVTYIGGGTAANSQISVDLSGATNAVDTTGLGIAATGVQGGGSELNEAGGPANGIRLDNAATSFLVSNTQDFSFHIATSSGNLDKTIPVTGGVSGLTGAEVISSLNTSLNPYGINASIATDGTLEFGGNTAFSVQAQAAGGGNPVAVTNSATINTANYNVSSAAGVVGGAGAVFTGFDGTHSETLVFQNATAGTTVVLDGSVAGSADTIDHALATLNAQLAGTGISAVADALDTSISFQSQNQFSVNETAVTAGVTGNLFGTTLGGATVTPSVTGASNTGSAIAALAQLTAAGTALGLTQGLVGAGINKLNYAVNLAQSQITNFSAAESGIKDANIAAEAANLTKAQVLQQASLAALAQANSAPQAVLALLKGQ